MEERYIAAIDLGTSKLAVCVASIHNQDVQIIYYKESPSAGIRNSCVTVPGKVLGKVRDALSDAQNELRIKIHQVVVGLPRWQVTQVTASAIAEREDDSRFISESEIRTLKSEALKSYPLADSKKNVIYGAVAQSYSTEDCVNEPENEIIGMSAEKLEGNFKVFIGSRTYSTNIDKLFSSMGIGIARKFFIPGITAKAILKAEEMESGVALIDIGAGVSSVTIFKDNLMRYYATIPFGGDSVTRDIESICGITHDLAENIKKAYGACMPEKLSTLGDKTLEIINEEGKAKKRISIKTLSEIVNARMEEIVNALLYKIQESGFSSEDYLKRGLVITGGGAELLNCINLFKDLSGYSVKLGLPNRYVRCDDFPEASSASAATAIGMILAMKGDRSINCIENAVFKPETSKVTVTPVSTQPNSPAVPEDSEKAGSAVNPTNVQEDAPKPEKNEYAGEYHGEYSEKKEPAVDSPIDENVTSGDNGIESPIEPTVLPADEDIKEETTEKPSEEVKETKKPKKKEGTLIKLFWKLYDNVQKDVEEGL